MKLTVNHKGTEVVYDETDYAGENNITSIRWNDQAEAVKDLIKTIFKEINQNS